MSDEINIQWPGWQINRIIGRGSFGVVYEIERSVFGEIEKAALKVISIPVNAMEIDELRSEGYDDESLTSRFRSYLEEIVKEYSTMAKMKGHPNVVYCDDIKFIQHDDGIGWDIYIKMELLTPIMKWDNPLGSENDILELGISISNALIQCKNRSLIHRDIKPQNIFVSADGTFKLGDFGIAKTAERTTGGTKVGTYKYMAPEVYNNQPYGASADQYSLGLVLYWLLNDKRSPFSPPPPQVPTISQEEEARNRRFSGEPLPPPAHGSKELKQIVLKACSFDPKDRFPDAVYFHDALVAFKEKNYDKLYSLLHITPVLKNAGQSAEMIEEVHDDPTVGAWGMQSGSDKDDTEGTIGAFSSKDSNELNDNKDSKKKSIVPVLIAGLTVLLLVFFALGWLLINKQNADPDKTRNNSLSTVASTESHNEMSIVDETKTTTLAASTTQNESSTRLETTLHTETTTQITSKGTTRSTRINATETSSQVIASTVPATVAVPNVVGETAANAISALNRQGFGVNSTESYSSTVGKGLVISQTPASGARLAPGAMVTITISKGAQPVSVTFNPNGGSVAQTSKDVGYGLPYGTLPVPAKDYCKFAGWYTAISGGTKVTDLTTVTNNSSHTLYARWEDNDLSDWTLASSVPSGVQIVDEKWTYTKVTWNQTNSGTWYYADFPSGFDKSHSLYSKYGGKSAMSNSTTSSKRVEVSSSTFYTYIYWHWCRGDHLGSDVSKFNRRIKTNNSSEFSGFHAFESNTAVSYTNEEWPYKYVNQGACDDSCWWFRFTVYQQTYKEYTKTETVLESTTSVSAGGDITNVQHYVRYRAK